MRESLAVVLMTKNEEARLAACLDHVAGWADEIVIIDDMSTDGTVEIAKRYTDKVWSIPSQDDHFEQWNRGIDRAVSQWILHIDADEFVTPALRDSIDQRLANPEGYSAFELMRRNIFLGRPMQYGGWYHRHLILFRRDRARCVGKGIHVRLRVDGPIGLLKADILHSPFSSIGQFISRQNHYTMVEAQVKYEEQGRIPFRHVIFQAGIRPLKLFWKFSVKKQGYRDGWHGVLFSLLFAFTHFLLWAKYWECAYATPHASRPAHG